MTDSQQQNAFNLYTTSAVLVAV